MGLFSPNTFPLVLDVTLLMREGGKALDFVYCEALNWILSKMKW